MHGNKDGEQSGALVSSRVMDIAVGLALLIGSVIFMLDSWQTGVGWRDDGPAPGFFPFWVALILAASSLINIARAMADREAAQEAFVRRSAFGRVLAVLLPTTAYVLSIGGLEVGAVRIPGLGIYLASALFVAGFMAMLIEPRPSLAVTVAGMFLALAMSALLTGGLLYLVKAYGNLPWIGLPIPIALLVAVALIPLPLGRYWPVFTLGPAVAIALFAMFEVWFLVPLVKGPIEAALGLG